MTNNNSSSTFGLYFKVIFTAGFYLKTVYIFK